MLFDVAGVRAIMFDHKDLDSDAQAKEEITEAIRAIEAGTGSVESPISATIDVNSLRASGSPEQRTLADILQSLADLRQMVVAGQRPVVQIVEPTFEPERRRALPERLLAAMTPEQAQILYEQGGMSETERDWVRAYHATSSRRRRAMLNQGKLPNETEASQDARPPDRKPR
jgi:hypothetical protein